jgi:hypothetical protein
LLLYQASCKEGSKPFKVIQPRDLGYVYTHQHLDISREARGNSH